MPETLTSACKHETFYYYPATNEDGWKCSDCGQPMPGEESGYRPDLDREYIGLKVGGLLNDLHMANLLYISNATGGDMLEHLVSKMCKERNAFDQYSIIQYIMELSAQSHREYWREIGEGVISGNDKRDRCYCGKLVTMYCTDGKFCSSACREAGDPQGKLEYAAQ